MLTQLRRLGMLQAGDDLQQRDLLNLHQRGLQRLQRLATREARQQQRGLVLGLGCTAFAYVLYFRLIAHAGPSRALAVTFITPVFAVLYGTLFLGEVVTPWMIGCALVIVCGTMLSTGLIRARQARATPAERA